MKDWTKNLLRALIIYFYELIAMMLLMSSGALLSTNHEWWALVLCIFGYMMFLYVNKFENFINALTFERKKTITKNEESDEKEDVLEPGDEE